MGFNSGLTQFPKTNKKVNKLGGVKFNYTSKDPFEVASYFIEFE